MRLHFYPMRLMLTWFFTFLCASLPSISPIFAQSDLSVTIRASQPTFSAWSYVTFYVVAKNNGNQTVNNVRVDFPMPSGATYDCANATRGAWESWTPQGYWQIGTLAAGDSAKLIATCFTFDVASISAPLSIGSTTPGFSDPQSSNNNASTTVTRGAAAPRLPCDGVVTQGDSIDLEVVSSINTAEINVGGTAAMVIQIKNRSNHNATNIKLKNIIPSSFSYLSNSVAQGSYTPSTGVWDVGEIPASGERSMTLNLSPTQAGNLKVTSQIIGVTQPDIDSRPDNYSPTATTHEDDEAELIIKGMQVDLELFMALAPNTPANLQVGQNVTFIIKLRNVGATRGDNCKVRAILPTGLSYVSSTASRGMYDAGVGVWLLSNVPDANGNKPGFTMQANDSITLELTAHINQTGTIAYNCEVRVCNMPDIDSTPSNMTAGEDDDATLSINVGNGNPTPTADLDLSMSATPTTVANGSNVTYLITLNNRGTVATNNIKVKDRLPIGLTFISATPSVGAFADSIWSIPSLASGAQATLSINVSVTNISNPIKNFAQVISSSIQDPDSSPNNNTTEIPSEDDEASATITPQSTGGGNTDKPDLEVLLTAPYTTAIPIYQNIDVVCKVRNVGNVAANNVLVSVAIPQGLSFVQHTAANGTYDAWGGVWNVGTVAANSEVTLTIRLFSLQTTMRMFAQVKSESPADFDSQPDNNSTSNPIEDDEALLAIPNVPTRRFVDMELELTADKNAIQRGTQVLFTVALENKGDTTATGVNVLFSVPTGMNFVASNAQQGSYNALTGIWTVGSLAANTRILLTVTDSVASDAGGIVAFAQVSAAQQNTDPDSTPNNNNTQIPNEDDESRTELSRLGTGSTCDLELSLTAPAQYHIYQNTDFTLTLRNVGGASATGVVVHFPFPEHFVFSAITLPSGTTYDNYTNEWHINSMTAGTSKTLTLSLFNLNASSPIKAFAQVKSASPTDADSAPNNNATTTPQEDDEATVTISPASGAQNFERNDTPQYIPVSLESFYPNPANNGVWVTIKSRLSDVIELQLLDIYGRVVLTDFKEVGFGKQEMWVDLSNQQAGVYFLRLKDNQLKDNILKIIKVNY